MAARFPAAELTWRPSPPPFTASRFHRRRSVVRSRRCTFLLPSRTPQRRPDQANRITCSRAAVAHGGGASRRREPLRRGTVSPRLPVPDHIPRPPYLGTDGLPDVCPDRQMHDSESIRHMRAACHLAARVLQHAGTMVKPWVTTDEIDRVVHQMIINAGAYPSPLGYGGFPKSVCTSVNECTCHGIPDSRALQDGDIINIDVTVYLNGYHGDTSRTYLVGDVDESAKQLVNVTEDCMMRGVAACKHGASLKEIGQKISEVAERHGYSVDPFVGHGVGRVFHSEPIIWHAYDYEPGFMVAGQSFTIEPTLSMGSTQCVLWDDGWTAVAADGSLSAQFEHTVLVTADGAEILTKC